MIEDIYNKKGEIAVLCQRRGITKLEVFGSAVREGDFDRERSDIDLLATFDNSKFKFTLLTYIGLKDEFEAIFGRRVDLVDKLVIEQSDDPSTIKILQNTEVLYAI